MRSNGLILILFLISGCSAGVTQKVKSLTTPTATPALTYDCSYYSQYNNLNDCQQATIANCSTVWQTFPNGGIQQCYQPNAGYASCSLNYTLPIGAPWIYTAWNYTCYDTVTTKYRRDRSVVECSDTVCACLATAITEDECVPGAASGTAVVVGDPTSAYPDAACTTPTPVPAPTAWPNCP